MKNSKFLLLGVIVVAVFAVQSLADTFTIVSDTTTPIVGIFDKSDNLQPAMATVSQNAVRAFEPRNASDFWFGPYVDPTDDTTVSLWDNSLGTTAYDYLQSVGADWIWETPHGEGSAAPGTAPFGSDPSLVGRVVVFEKTFSIDGIPTAGSLVIEADNCWEVRINGNFVARADTCVADWELTDLHGASVQGDGWMNDELTIDASSFLTSGENTITILAGNEYHGWDIYGDSSSGADEGDLPVPAWNQVSYVGTTDYYQYNPGALIFALEVTYINPDTLVGIDASADTVDTGGTVDLFVSEENTGDAPLDNVSVTVNDGTSDIATLVAPPDSGDNGNNILDPGEIWMWTINDVVINDTTTFTATGYGEDSLDNPITYPEYENEQAAVTVEAQEETGDEGCTPGFWKNNADKKDAVAWVGYSPDDLFSDVFGVDITIFLGGNKNNPNNYLDDPTLLEALGANGSGINLLARSAVAALLNASNPNIDYPASEAEIIDAVYEVVTSGSAADIQALGELLDDFNNLGCPINQDGEPIIE